MLHRLTIILLIAIFTPLALAQERVKEPTEKEKQVQAARAAAEAKARAILEQRIPQLNLSDVSFKDAIDFLRDITGANVHVNWRAVEQARIDGNAPINLKVRDVAFSKALNLILAEVSGSGPRLAWVLDDGVIEISTAEMINRVTQIKIYEVRDLLDPKAVDKKGEILMMIITDSIAPTSWAGSGGKGAIKYHDGKLIITQTAENHQAIQNLLDGLREFRR